MDGSEDVADSGYAATFDAEMLGSALAQLGVHPDDLAMVLRYSPLGLTLLCWRNTVLEDWHAGPDSRISDAEMMRANVATTRLCQQALWSAFQDWIVEGDLFSRGSLDDEGAESALEAAFADLLEAGFDADRDLPHGPTLGELAGPEYDELLAHVETQLGAMLDQAERKGVHVVLMWLALKGRLGCDGWWGSTRWPYIVDLLLARLDDRDDDFWARWGWREPPEEVEDRDRFRHLLLSAPDQLTTDTLDYLIHTAGIGFIRPE